ncbi:MAG: glycosyltransferase family 2 protein [Actinobacteria bacterium]|nr:MAG: glycosyltransferase family 2 protein [Actinomycetota bacterium]
MTSISIVIPVHGRAHLTERCLDLMLSDLDERCEVVVVDDASPDGTPDLLARYADRVRVVRLEENAGFAVACNRGAEAAAGESLVFLNNDTEPRPGWLESLRRYADDHLRAAVMGAKLLYPTGTVQHAGIVFGQDGYPHHLYAGFPSEHPAVSHPRRLQAVTAACMWVDRAAFDRVGGFDTGFHNSLEDVDLCLRIGQAGGEVHYCPEAELVHMESASRGRSDRFERSVALYRERWRERVHRDDLEIYESDGLIAVEYADTHPIRLSVDPRLAIVDRGREEEIEGLLEAYARQNADLIQEVVRLSASPLAGEALELDAAVEPARFDRGAFIARLRQVGEEVRRLQLEAGPLTGLEPSDRLGYGRMVERVRAAIEEAVPADSEVLVVSRGDRELTRLGGRKASHFPQGEGGGFAGHHPADSAAAIDELERLRAAGAQYLAIPPTAAWWGDYYRGFFDHLRDRYERVDNPICEIFRLEGAGLAGRGFTVPR